MARKYGRSSAKLFADVSIAAFIFTAVKLLMLDGRGLQFGRSIARLSGNVSHVLTCDVGLQTSLLTDFSVQLAAFSQGLGGIQRILLICVLLAALIDMAIFLYTNTRYNYLLWVIKPMSRVARKNLAAQQVIDCSQDKPLDGTMSENPDRNITKAEIERSNLTLHDEDFSNYLLNLFIPKNVMRYNCNIAFGRCRSFSDAIIQMPIVLGAIGTKHLY